MDIDFRSNRTRKECEQAQAARQTHGKSRSQLLQRRLSQLHAAACLEDLRNLPGLRLHQHVRLKGQLKATFSVDLDGGWRLLFEASETPEPSLPAGGVDWQQVTAITILSIEDPHG